MCCVCVFSSHSFWTSSSLDVPAGVTQEEGHTGFLYPPFFCGACLNFSREKDSVIPLFFSEKNPVCRDRTHVPTYQKVTYEVTSELPGRPDIYYIIYG